MSSDDSCMKSFRKKVLEKKKKSCRTHVMFPPVFWSLKYMLFRLWGIQQPILNSSTVHPKPSCPCLLQTGKKPILDQIQQTDWAIKIFTYL